MTRTLGAPTFIFEGGVLVHPNPLRLERADLWVREGRVVVPGSVDQVPGEVQRVDCRDCLLVPGLVCGHGHLYSALATGMPAPAVSPTCFVEILERVWWRLDEALDEASLRASALVGGLGALLAGTTTIIDHHASPGFIDGSLDVIADALEEVGLRGVLCYEVTDRGGADRRDAGLRENERFLQSERELARGLVGAHASFTLSAESLAGCVDLAQRQGSGLHIHVAEDQADQRACLEQHGKRVLARLAEAGALGPRTLLAHGVHLDEKERALLAASPAWIAHNPRSNMNNTVGYADPFSFGPRVVLGTDGIGADMCGESHFAFFRAREQRRDTDAASVWRWLCNGADLVSDLFGARVGRFDEGAAADVVVLDGPWPTPVTSGSFPWHWIFAVSSRMVRDVMVNGRLVIRGRQLLTADQERIFSEARQQACRLWGRL